MSLELLVFYALAGLLLLASTLVVIVRNPVHAALWLVLAFFASGALWVMLEAEFLALTLVLVYVGAVMVLFLFVVMMLDVNLARLRAGFAGFLPVGVVVAALMVAAMTAVVGSGTFGGQAFPPPARLPADHSNTEALGRLLYTGFLYPFEIASVVLLVAIVAAIALTMRGTRQTKTQRPEWQVSVRRADRVRLVRLPSEPRA